MIMSSISYRICYCSVCVTWLHICSSLLCCAALSFFLSDFLNMRSHMMLFSYGVFQGLAVASAASVTLCSSFQKVPSMQEQTWFRQKASNSTWKWSLSSLLECCGRFQATNGICIPSSSLWTFPDTMIRNTPMNSPPTAVPHWDPIVGEKMCFILALRAGAAPASDMSVLLVSLASRTQKE